MVYKDWESSGAIALLSSFLGAGAVRLDHVDVAEPEAGVGQCVPDRALLGLAARRGQAVGGPGPVGGRPPDEAEHLMAVGPCPGQPLDQQQRRHLRSSRNRSRRRRTTGTPAVFREADGPHEVGVHVRGRVDRDTAGEREVAFPDTQRLAREVQRDQRRGARGVHCGRWAFQPELVGDPPGHHGAGDAGDQVVVGFLAGLRGDRVEPVERADEHAGPAPAQGQRVDPTVFHGFPCGFE